MIKIQFKDLPDTTTPLNANNLNTMQDNIEDAIDNIEIPLDSVVSTSSTNGVENQAITNYVNDKIKGTILWTNSNPNTSFDAQTISLNSSDYDVLEIYYKHFYSDAYVLSQRTLKGTGTILLTNIAGSLARRQITQPTDTSLSITAGDNTSAMIPIYVVGYKTGLFD